MMLKILSSVSHDPSEIESNMLIWCFVLFEL